MNDPWLPDEKAAYVQTNNAALVGQPVSSLMSLDGSEWDADLILDMFDSRDANIILSIPLNAEVEDSWYWRKEKMGRYSVKSAYRLLQDDEPSLNTDANSGFWRNLWNLKIPPKVKNFLWRASTNSLPTKDMLRIRKVQVNELCPMCNDHPESVIHILVSCVYATSCWEKFNQLQVQGEFNTFAEWLRLTFQQFSTSKANTISTICWMIWKSRNELIWNQSSLDPSEVVHSACSILNQWKSVQDRTFDRFLGHMSQEDGAEHWSLPLPGIVKINSDATIFENSNLFSYAFITRNHEGGMVEARSKCLRGHPGAELAEAMGIREALSWLKNKDCRNVVVESDCLQVIQATRSSFPCYSYLGRVIQECRDLLTSLQPKNVKLIFVKWSANKVAHYLAKQNCSLADRIWRMGDVHPELQHVLSNDLSN